MDAGLMLQYVVVALIVLASAWVVVKKQMPGTVRRVRGAIALGLVKPDRSAWLQALGRRIAPPATGGGACGGCDSCGPTPPKQHR
ncbi:MULTISPECIES: DUF6587 family protein [unclassified Stenotrophomonas]|uniref:DUF6587 family protein n=1 Tax=unclassified Stenotrophomonas TaxID=196198 RepID=UPI000C9EA7B2|nr:MULTISPECIES: DUF6587 family protein [unclassified Stenotrophomonas]